ncbi:MAG: formate/nitrite transporter family protein [Methanomassiliicoccaceae archaeon]|nr:formate/nitrite transporter family protein [Methanomassiliicoccaceae archaeon]
MDVLKIFVSSILAGVMIGIGGSVFLQSDYKFVGAILFAVGLFGIMSFKLHLYTGKAGYILENKPIFLAEILIIIVGNFIGCLAMGLAFPLDQAVVLVDKKLSADLLIVFFKAICCGILMFIAVDVYKTKKSFLGVFVCVPAFILAGFEHSIANMFFLSSAGAFTMDAFIFTLVVLLGNAVGCLAIPAYKKYLDKEDPAPSA